MSCDYRPSIRSAPDSAVLSEQDPLHLPPISPNHSQTAYPPNTSYSEEITPTLSPVWPSSTYDIIVIPQTPNNETAGASLVQDEIMLQQLWQWTGRYRDWQIRLVMAVIAQFSKLHVIECFNTILLPFLCTAKHNTFLTRTAPLIDTSLSRSLSLTPQSGRGEFSHINIPHLPLSVRSYDFFPKQEIPRSYMQRRNFKPIPRPKTGVLLREFRSELQTVSRWVAADWARPLLLVKFMCDLVKRSSASQLQFFAGCLRKRLRARLDVNCLSDSLLMHVFSFLDPLTLSRVAVVSRRWRELALNPVMWRNKVRMFGAREGVPDLDQCLEQGETGPVIWREAFIQLYNVYNSYQLSTAQAIIDDEKDRRSKIQREISQRELNASLLDTKLMSKTEILRVMRDKNEGDVPAENVQSPLKTPSREEKGRQQEVAGRKSKAKVRSDQVNSSKSAHLPVIRKDDSSRHKETKKIRSKEPHQITPAKRGQQPRIYGREVIWRVFDFIHISASERVTPSSKFYTCLALAGCIPSSHSCNQEVRLPPPLFPLRSVRLLTQVPSMPLFSVACDSRRVLVSGTDLNIRVYDYRSGIEIGCLEGHKGVVNCIDFLGGLVVTGAWDCTVVVWDAVHFELVHVIHAHSDSVTRLLVDERFLISGSKCGEVSVWSVGTWELVSALELHAKSITGICLSKQVLYTASLDGKVGIWNVTDWRLITSIDNKSPVTSMAVRLGLCVVGCTSGYIRFWNLSSCKEEMSELNYSHKLSEHLKNQDQLSIRFTLPSPVNSISVQDTYVFATNSTAVYQWSLVTCSLVRILLAHDGPITCLAGDKHKLVSVGEDGRIVVWHTRNKPHTLSNYPNSLVVFGDIKRINL